METQKVESGASIPEHPLLAHLHANKLESVTALQGYVGPSPTEGRIKLYASLDDLSDYIEIAKSDIIHFAELPETVLPFGGTKVWLKKGAEFTRNRTETITAGATEGSKADPDLIDVNKGRLRIQVRKGLMARDCTSRCECACTSRCNCWSHGCA